MSKIILENKTVLIVLGEHQKEMVISLLQNGVLIGKDEIISTKNALLKYIEVHPASRHEPKNKMDEGYLVSDDCVNEALKTEIQRKEDFINESPFSIICLTGAIQTATQLNFLQENTFFNLRRAERIIFLVEAGRRMKNNLLEEIGWLDIKHNNFKMYSYDPSEVNNQQYISKIVYRLGLPAVPA